jgi:hypothetical protein
MATLAVALGEGIVETNETFCFCIAFLTISHLVVWKDMQGTPTMLYSMAI